MTGEPPRVVLVTRVGCHLCADAEQLVRRVCHEYDVSVALRDVDATPEDAARWGDWVPVLLVDDREVDSLRVSEARLRAALEVGRGRL